MFCPADLVWNLEPVQRDLQGGGHPAHHRAQTHTLAHCGQFREANQATSHVVEENPEAQGVHGKRGRIRTPSHRGVRQTCEPLRPPSLLIEYLNHKVRRLQCC